MEKEEKWRRKEENCKREVENLKWKEEKVVPKCQNEERTFFQLIVDSIPPLPMFQNFTVCLRSTRPHGHFAPLFAAVAPLLTTPLNLLLIFLPPW